MLYKTVFFLILLSGLDIVFVNGQSLAIKSNVKLNKKDVQEDKVIKFLNLDTELRKYYDCNFVGKFTQIPNDIKIELSENLPDYDFKIAEMEQMIDLPAKKRNLILIIDKKNNEVVAFVWSLNWMMPSSSFKNILFNKQVESDIQPAKIAKSLTNLILYTGNASIGNISSTKKRVKIEIMLGKEVFRTLELRIKNKTRYGDILIKKQNGKEIK